MTQDGMSQDSTALLEIEDWAEADNFATPEQTSPADTPVERAGFAEWLAVSAGVLAAFMAVLDMTIVSAALPVIQGEIGASPSEGTWIGTAYLIAEIVVIPLTAWLVRLIGLCQVMLIGATVFTGFSMACGNATNLTEMVVARVGQGLAGATLIPMAFTIVATRLPRSQQHVGMALSGATALLGPIIGPLIGGWITENYGWRYAFFMNLPVYCCVLPLVMVSLPRGGGDWSELRKADWCGISGMMLALGSLVAVLETGHREQWFQSGLIVQLTLAGVVGVVLVAIGQLTAERPVIKLKLLRNPALAAPIALQLTMGALLFGTLFTIPQFLVIVAGYNSQQAGQVIFVTGISAIIGAILFGISITRIDVRLIVGAAFLLQSYASHLAGRLTPFSVGNAFYLPQVFLGAGLTLASIPQHTAAMAAASAEDASETSGLLVIARNLGASLGLAVIATLQQARLDVHYWRLQETLGANDAMPQQHVADLGAQFGSDQIGYQALDSEVSLHALVMTFNDIFAFLSIAALVVAPMVIFMRPYKAGGHGAAH
jgi:DHA2 family multidrug resistance protein